MNVKGLNDQGINSYQPQAERAEETAARLAKARDMRQGREGDTLRLSHEARLHTAARSTAMQADDMRRERVDVLKAQVANGTYQIDNAKIAANLLKEESDLFRP